MSDRKKVSLAREPAAVYVSPSKLTPFEKNARDKQPVDKVAESIRRFGFGAPILARTDGEIIAGHTRWQAALKLKLDEVPVRYMDISQADARLLGIADNRLGEEAEWNEDKLKQILEDISKERPESDWSGTGLSDADLNRILSEKLAESYSQDDYREEWKGMPEYDVEDKTPCRQIIVSFKTEEDAKAFGKFIGQTITEKTKSIWYPKAEIETCMDKAYIEVPETEI